MRGGDLYSRSAPYKSAMHTVQVLNHLVENNQIFAYLVILLVTIVEGEIVGISAGILILLGALNFWLCLLALFCGAMLKTIIGYFLGGFLHKKLSGYGVFRYLEKRVFTIMPHFEEKPFWSIFISKFLMINHIVIIFAGYKKINFKKYMQAEISSTLIWVPALLVLGYFFGYTAIRVSKGITEFSLIIILFIIAFFLFDKLVTFLYDVFENLIHHHGEKT